MKAYEEKHVRAVQDMDQDVLEVGLHQGPALEKPGLPV